ncbi:MAG: hypothetical protein ABI972_31130 [Acidobacteriota bacterium]
MRPLLRSLGQLALVALAAVAWTFLTVVIAKPLHDLYSGIPFSPTAPDMWVDITAILLWIAASIYICRQPAITLTAKIATWLVLPPMAWLLMLMYAVMRLPG